MFESESLISVQRRNAAIFETLGLICKEVLGISEEKRNLSVCTHFDEQTMACKLKRKASWQRETAEHVHHAIGENLPIGDCYRFSLIVYEKYP